MFANSQSLEWLQCANKKKITKPQEGKSNCVTGIQISNPETKISLTDGSHLNNSSDCP